MPRKKGDNTIRARARKARNEAAPAVVDGQVQTPGGGLLASEVKTREVAWMFYPWIPKALLSMVVGNPCVGKSTFLAGLVAHASGGDALEDDIVKRDGKVIFLPGHEEDLEVMTVPRLLAAGAKLHNVKLLLEERISLPRDKEMLARQVSSFGASLLVGDPIDSYIEEGLRENDGQHVRPVLEAASWIARKTGAAVVFARHPGKDRDNVMPGSRAWRAVPRSIVQLTTDGGMPPRFIISHFKDSLGTLSVPREYTLQQKACEAPRLLLGEEMERSASDFAGAATGLTGRYRLMHACRLIRWFMEEEEEPTRVKLGEEARRQGLGEDILAEALRLLTVKSVPPGRRGDPWILVRMVNYWPAWLPPEEGGGSPPE